MRELTFADDRSPSFSAGIELPAKSALRAVFPTVISRIARRRETSMTPVYQEEEGTTSVRGGRPGDNLFINRIRWRGARQAAED
jgi:hypothetical protein